MDVRLDDNQRLVRDTAARVAQAAALAVLPVDTVDTGNDALWATLCNTGFVALRENGGSTVDAALVAEQLALSLCVVPYVGQGVIAPALLQATGADDLVQTIAAGTCRVAPALDQGLTDFGRAGDAVVAWDAGGATEAVVLDTDGRGVIVVKLTGDELPALDRTRSCRNVLTVANGVASFVAPKILDKEALLKLRSLAYVMVTADLVGVMQGALDAAVGYVKDRQQFGVPVGSFQAVQHLAADAAVMVEAARSSLWHAAWAADTLGAADGLLAARQAKAYSSRVARTVVEASVQMHGGIAITWEHLSHVRLRRVLFGAASFGSERAHLQAIAGARLGGRS